MMPNVDVKNQDPQRGMPYLSCNIAAMPSSSTMKHNNNEYVFVLLRNQDSTVGKIPNVIRPTRTLWVYYVFTRLDA